MKTIIIFIFIFAAWIIGTLSTFNLKCPQNVQRYIRSQQVCPRNPMYYSCLCNTENTTCSTGNEEIIHEYCNDKPEFAGIGQKYVWSGALRNIECSSERFQPPGFNLWQNVSSQCIYLKSFCNEEGQVIHINGSAEKDVYCRCDHTKGYDFVANNNTDNSSCKSFEEDCACYMKKCLSNETLAKDYSCIPSSNENTLTPNQPVPAATRQSTVDHVDLIVKTTEHPYRINFRNGLTVLICLFVILGCLLMIVCLLGDLNIKCKDHCSDRKELVLNPEGTQQPSTCFVSQFDDHLQQPINCTVHQLDGANGEHEAIQNEISYSKDLIRKRSSTQADCDKTISVVVFPQEVNEYVGCSCRFNASISSIDGCIKKIEWVHITTEKKITCDLGNTKKYRTDDPLSLTILSLESADAGKYVCRVSNSYGTIDSEHVILNVKEYKPSISHSLGKHTIDNEVKTILKFILHVPEIIDIYLLFKKNDTEEIKSIPKDVALNESLITCYFPICCSGKYELIVKTLSEDVHRQTLYLQIPSEGTEHLKEIWSFDKLQQNLQKDDKKITVSENIDCTHDLCEEHQIPIDKQAALHHPGKQTHSEKLRTDVHFLQCCFSHKSCDCTDEAYQLTTDNQTDCKESVLKPEDTKHTNNCVVPQLDGTDGEHKAISNVVCLGKVVNSKRITIQAESDANAIPTHNEKRTESTSTKDALEKSFSENTAQNIDSTQNLDESQESTTDEKPETTTENIDSTEYLVEDLAEITTDIQPESKELNNDFYTSLKKTNVRAVIALDVGTTHSRYAVLITETLSCKEKWEPVIEDSVPTAVLFKDSSKNYIACGDEALPEYICTIENGERESYLMFEKFKLELYKRMDITAEMKIKDGYGRPMLAIDVYTAVINDLKQRALIHTERKKIEEIQIAWVMTVPDVWNKNAKDFIQLTCESSGIPKEQLIIEDESIAILKYFQDVQYFCKEKIISQNLDDKNYLLIDLGGGTCDITGYHVTADCDVGVPIKSTHIACGVDIACNAILDRISSMIGERAMECMKEEETSSFLQLKEACLQLCKTSEYTLKLNVPIQIFDKLCKRFRLMSFEETVNDFGKTLSCGNSKHIDIDFKLSGDKLIVRKGLIDDSLKVVIGTVISEIKHILKTQKAQDIQQFFIVGGFSSLLIVQNEIQEAFKEKSVFFANDKVYSSVKGALLCRCNKIRME